MSDDWGNRRELDDEDEKDEGGVGRPETGKWISGRYFPS